jgi:hypothetical protein
VSLPTPAREYTIAKLLGQKLGVTGKNQRDILVQVKNAMVASGWWSVTRSCDGFSIASSDLWLTWANVVGTGGHVSWIQLTNAYSGAQLLINVTVDGTWCEIQWFTSPAAGFTGGNTLGTRPTATDEYQSFPPAGADWLGTLDASDTDPQWRAYVWVSTDGANTRVAWMYQGPTTPTVPKLNAFWQFDTLTSTAGGAGSWVPWTTYCWDGGGFVAPSVRMTMTTFKVQGQREAKTPSGTIENITNLAVWPVLQGGNNFVDTFPTNLATGQWYWSEPLLMGVTGGGGVRNGAIGYLDDQWWVGSTSAGNVPVFNDGDTAGNGAFIFMGAMMLPWDGTLAPAGYMTSTDRAADLFFGRNCTGGSGCNCGPDDCDEPTTTLITMRNGAKELADKVDDDSVSDTTWNLWINQGVEDLWKKIVEATGDAFLATHDFTLAGGVGGNSFDVTTIPARDFRRLRLLELNPDTANRRRIRPFNLVEKDDGVAGSRWGNFDPQTWDRDRRYRRMGNSIYVERYELAAGAYRVYYEPKALAAPLAETCDHLPDVLDEWAEYPQVFAAMKALGKEESDPGYLPTRLAEMRADIATLKGEPDDDADASTIADVEDGGPSGGDWP